MHLPSDKCKLASFTLNSNFSPCSVCHYTLHTKCSSLEPLQPCTMQYLRRQCPLYLGIRALSTHKLGVCILTAFRRMLASNCYVLDTAHDCMRMQSVIPIPYGAEWGHLQGPKQAPRYTPHAGMAMFGLQQVQLYWERALDTKARPACITDPVVASSNVRCDESRCETSMRE